VRERYPRDAGATIAAGSQRVDVRLENAAAAAIEPPHRGFAGRIDRNLVRV